MGVCSGMLEAARHDFGNVRLGSRRQSGARGQEQGNWGAAQGEQRKGSSTKTLGLCLTKHVLVESKAGLEVGADQGDLR